MARDFINLGSIGYAQLGSDDYFYTKQVEKKVLEEFLETEIFKIPEEFQHMCNFGIKKFPYEFDSYHEAVLYFDEDILDTWQDEYENKLVELGIEDYETEEAYELLKDVQNKCEAFWDFANKAELIDFETEELFNKCRKQFAIDYPMEVVHRNKIKIEEVKLKKVQ